MKLYRFDGISADLELIPLAARRALDLAGAKLSLGSFRHLEPNLRRLLVEAGSVEDPDLESVRRICAGAHPPAEAMDPISDPAPERVPPEVQAALGSARPLTDDTWASLSSLDRYALAKTARGGKRERLAAAYEEIVGAASPVSTHVRPEGGVHMVSVSGKEPTLRRARAECWVTMSEVAFTRLMSPSSPKGDVLATARLAGIQGAKRTSDVIPLCHPLSLTYVDVDFEADERTHRLRVLVTVEVFDRTGVEMEAMVGASIAGLTVYDMLKAADRAMSVGPTRLLAKSGGKSGDFVAQAAGGRSAT